jgi:hypothetical protein
VGREYANTAFQPASQPATADDTPIGQEAAAAAVGQWQP